MVNLSRVIISGGGTGGHIFPALSIAKTLCKRYPNIEILFVGAEGRMEMERIPKEGFKIVGLPVEGLKRGYFWENFKVLKKAFKSLFIARDIIKEFQPQVVVGVGGYASMPTLKAAQSLGIPTLIQEQNSYAGLSNKILARRAKKICVAYPNMERFFKKERIVLTGNPIRSEIENLSVTKEEALAYFGFDASIKGVILSVGGSLGARTINESIAKHIKDWEASGYALIWQTGRLFEQKAKETLKDYQGVIYCNTFIDRMDLAYLLADVVISRAGASSISELALLGKASVLVPLPTAAEDHQSKNVQALSEKGAAILVRDNEAREQLSSEVFKLMEEDELRKNMSDEIRKFALPNASERIVDELEKIVEEYERK